MLENATHRLRALEPEDIDQLLKWENDSKNWWLGTSITPYSRATLLKFATGDHDLYRDRQLRYMLDYNNNEGDWVTVGAIDMYEFDVRNLRAGVGVIVDTAHRRKGHARQGIELIKNYMNVHLGLNQLYAEIPSSNSTSIQLFRQLGFKECGVKKDWVRGMEGWEDVILMQLIFSEITDSEHV